MKRGRRSVLDQEIVILATGPSGQATEQRYKKGDLVLDVIRRGASRIAACGFAQVNHATFRQWLVEARRGHEPFRTFLTRLEAAEEEAVVRAEMDIFKTDDWRAKVAWLQLRQSRVMLREEIDRLAREFGKDPEEVEREAERVGMRVWSA